MKSINSYKEIIKVIESGYPVLLYLSREECGLCKSLKPKVENLIKEYQYLKAYYVDLNIDPVVAGQLSIFTIPGILIYIDGKESYREARYISIEHLKNYLERLKSILNSL